MLLMPQPLHSPHGKKRSGVDAATLGGPLVMQVVRFKVAVYRGKVVNEDMGVRLTQLTDLFL